MKPEATSGLLPRPLALVAVTAAMVLKEVVEIGLGAGAAAAVVAAVVVVVSVVAVKLEASVGSPVLIRLVSGVGRDMDEVESTRGRRLDEEEEEGQALWLSGEREGLEGWEWELDCIPNAPGRLGICCQARPDPEPMGMICCV